jgi:citrate lyase alpha subunit
LQLFSTQPSKQQHTQKKTKQKFLQSSESASTTKNKRRQTSNSKHKSHKLEREKYMSALTAAVKSVIASDGWMTVHVCTDQDEEPAKKLQRGKMKREA